MLFITVSGLLSLFSLTIYQLKEEADTKLLDTGALYDTPFIIV